MAIQQHPIPQNVTQYQFRLVGDMTLKQFLELAGGIVGAVIIYALPLPVFFKWPLMFVSAGLGAGMAFLPVEGRPMGQWIVAFIKSIYQPTIYTWKKTAPSSTSITPKPEPIKPTPTITITTKPKEVVSSISPSPREVYGAVGTPTPEPPTTKTTPPPQTVFAAPKVDTGILHIEKQPLLAAPKTLSGSTIGQPISAPTTPTPSSSPQTSAPKPSLLPIPHPPQTPNTIVGMTLTPGGTILDSSIVDIIFNRATIRATKSNKLGQFLFAKPLDNGLYQITAEKQGYTFPTYSLNLTGQIIPPIELKALSQSNL